MIQLLHLNRWSELTDIFRSEFDSYLPHAGTSHIVADVAADGTIKGFVVVEMLARIGQIYQPGENAREMLKGVESMMSNMGVIAISSDPRFDGLCEKFGMEKVEGTVYRRDF